MPFPSLRSPILLVTLLVLALAIYLSQNIEILSLSRNFLSGVFSNSAPTSGQKVDGDMKNPRMGVVSNASSTERRTPVYFLSHGGPNIMYEKDHPVYPQLQKIGLEITQNVKPKAVVVFSAHWQGGPNAVEVNTFENTELIYDFYGFPDHYYKETYPNKGSFPLSQRVIEVLTKHNIDVTGTRRGLDHGVWASFKVAFDPHTNPLNIPIIQVSLFASDSPTQHLSLGRAISSLRSENILLIMSGMAVHNLRDMRFGTSGAPMPYAPTFDEALRAAVEFEGDVEEREEMMVELLRRKDARGAHPSFEHLLPVHVAVGAAAGDRGVRLWTLVEGSFSWAMFRWGEVWEEGRL
ncbi:putative aromatic ring-opening dioxygenase LigB subunit [Rhexocercosporidium sp. MPI-PUGE-AT-0058]|nr:putative aromatic ring-opening dioxygenase LigB subunit [Rhexocercosporidium sp. MPI-PUGE-AT-0058]